MREVWLVLKHIPYEPSIFIGAFDNEDDAHLAAYHPYDRASVHLVTLGELYEEWPKEVSNND